MPVGGCKNLVIMNECIFLLGEKREESVRFRATKDKCVVSSQALSPFLLSVPSSDIIVRASSPTPSPDMIACSPSPIPIDSSCPHWLLCNCNPYLLLPEISSPDMNVTKRHPFKHFHALTSTVWGTALDLHLLTLSSFWGASLCCMAQRPCSTLISPPGSRWSHNMKRRA